MQTLAGISILCVLCVGYTHAQGEEFLGILDFDTYGLDLKEDDFLRDRDIFNDNKEFEERLTEETITRLCNEYDLFLDNQNLDCSKIKLVQKPLKTEHNLQKRDAEETQLEGSGDEDAETPAPEQSPKEDPEQPEEQPPPPAIPPNEAPPTEQPDDQPPPSEIKGEADEAPETDAKEAGAAEEPKEPPETATEVPAKEENPTTPETVRETEKEGLETESAAKEEGEANAEATDKPVNEEDNGTTIAGVLKKGRKLEAGDIEPETDKKEGETDEAKEEEKLNEHQSGNAVVEGASGATMEQHEQDVNAMAPKANIKAASSEGEPKQGESAKETEGSRKDTKILIILFVAVVVIGAAAFSYNFIKKRKQKKAEMSGTENGDNNIKVRSLQNLSGQAKADPENGTELKPLMKTAEKPVVAEFKDENKQ